MGPVSGAATIRVAVAYSPSSGEAYEVELNLARGATAFDAIRASGVLERNSGIDVSTQAVGIWGRVASLDTLLGDGDRVEIYRPLTMNPNDARRLRASKKK
jgi:putative ubiquitin-RnfH superfamily antitoxin RatB of RatAB toxin-antitoxin module